MVGDGALFNEPPFNEPPFKQPPFKQPPFKQPLFKQALLDSPFNSLFKQPPFNSTFKQPPFNSPFKEALLDSPFKQALFDPLVASRVGRLFKQAPFVGHVLVRVTAADSLRFVLLMGGTLL